jgi:hypothetical protein
MEWSSFVSRHWAIGESGHRWAWFIAGLQDFSNKKFDAAIGWQCVAVLIILVLCGCAAVRGSGSVPHAGSQFSYLEIRSIRRVLAIQAREDRHF